MNSSVNIGARTMNLLLLESLQCENSNGSKFIVLAPILTELFMFEVYINLSRFAVYISGI